MAPRVHNSGHWTIEGSTTSQFENHIRAITGLTLGDCTAIGKSRMLNCIGEMPDREEILQNASAHYHDYAKEPRPGRKVGHITYHN
jgi:5-(carboxyamino)imidazole ribonucleotide synthase